MIGAMWKNSAANTEIPAAVFRSRGARSAHQRRPGRCAAPQGPSTPGSLSEILTAPGRLDRRRHEEFGNAAKGRGQHQPGQHEQFGPQHRQPGRDPAASRGYPVPYHR